jgi:hypothetical protein
LASEVYNCKFRKFEIIILFHLKFVAKFLARI